MQRILGRTVREVLLNFPFYRVYKRFDETHTIPSSELTEEDMEKIVINTYLEDGRRVLLIEPKDEFDSFYNKYVKGKSIQ